MSAVQRVLREPNALVGAVVAVLGLLVLFGLNLSNEQLGGIVTALGAVVILLRQLVVPASEVIAQQQPGKTQAVAGPAASVATGTLVDVTVAPRPDPGTPVAPPPDERGATTPWFGGLGLLLLVVVVIVVL